MYKPIEEISDERASFTIQVTGELNRDITKILSMNRFSSRSDFVRYAIKNLISKELEEYKQLEKLDENWEPKFDGGKAYLKNETNFIKVDDEEYWVKTSGSKRL